MLKLLLWTSISAVVYTWVIFPALLWAASRIVRRPPAESSLDATPPTVSVVLAVRNEERMLRHRLENLLALAYPPERLEIIVVSDYSNDRTEEIAGEFGAYGVRLLRATSRGKSSAQNEGVAHARGEIIVFTDADTEFAADFLSRIVGVFRDASVGCVTGRFAIPRAPGEPVSEESRYWRYEFRLWKWESDLGLLFLSGGMCMAVRRTAFRPIPAHLGDDSYLPLDVIAQGRRVAFVPEAIAWDKTGETRAGIAIRARMVVRSLPGTLRYPRLLNPFVRPGLAWAIVSHKLLRWFAPYFMLIALAVTAARSNEPGYGVLLALQGVLYVMAVIGYLAERWRVPVPIVSIPYKFCLVNVGFLVGTWRSFRRARIVAYR